jgi:hypothetical protein
MAGLLLPLPARDESARPFWAAAERGRLMLMRCRACATVHATWNHPCPACGSPEQGWTAACGAGRIYSFVVAHPAGGGAGQVIAVVELVEGARLMAELDPGSCVAGGAGPGLIGRPVEVSFHADSGGVWGLRVQLAD